MHNTMDLREEQDLAYLEAEQIDFIKALSKKEQEDKEQREKLEHEEAMQTEKLSLEALRAKRLKALSACKTIA
jgi:hypothetical protein